MVYQVEKEDMAVRVCTCVSTCRKITIALDSIIDNRPLRFIASCVKLWNIEYDAKRC